MDYRDEYRRWMAQGSADVGAELAAIGNDEQEIRDRFEASLEFGTAGLRGVIGMGTNRMNYYTVSWATQGLADYLNERYGGGTVAVSYDSRNMSEEFAKTAAGVLAANGIEVYIYSELMPTPMLSFAVRELSAKAGIMITASHNPAKYNGYKVYGSDGCQMTIEDSAAVLARIKKIDVLNGAKHIHFAQACDDGLVHFIGRRVIEKYYDEVKKQQLNPGICVKYPVRIVYTPLNGTGNKPVRRILDDIGVKDITIVKEQELPDGDFTTCPFPNPELAEALELGLRQSEKVKPDLLLATDPDCDRVCVALRDDNEFRILTGNEIGILLFNYICTARNDNKLMPRNPIAVRSIVSTSLVDKIAADSGVEIVKTLTGFKFIGEQILMLEQQNEVERYIFGFEESCGYLAGSYVRDKDAVFASMMICEMTSYYKSKGKRMVDILNDLYKKYGYCMHRVLDRYFEGPEGGTVMKGILAGLRAEIPAEIDGLKVVSYADFLSQERKNLETGETQTINLPASDVLEYDLENGAIVMIRPSGTEPKMKTYLTVFENSAAESSELLDKLQKFAEDELMA